MYIGNRNPVRPIRHSSRLHGLGDSTDGAVSVSDLFGAGGTSINTAAQSAPAPTDTSGIDFNGLINTLAKGAIAYTQAQATVDIARANAQAQAQAQAQRNALTTSIYGNAGLSPVYATGGAPQSSGMTSLLLLAGLALVGFMLINRD